MKQNEPMFELDAKEQEILDSYERGEWQAVPNWQSLLPSYQEAARATLEELGLVNIQLSKEDFNAIKERAQDAGVPYQKFISNILHKLVNGDLVNR